jgi:hypothetical protein
MTHVSSTAFLRSIAVSVSWAVLLGTPLRAGELTGPLSYAADNQVLPASPSKKLIEFGWDEPDTGTLKNHRDQFERSPFDGCVFHVATRDGQGPSENFTWLCWGRRRFTDAALQPARDELASIAWTRFRHNFLRFNVTPADLDWFDDHSAVLANARLAAQVASAGHCDGILLDTEAYQAKLFDYHKQRDASRRSWDDYAAQARNRGHEVMSAFQDGFPDLTVLLTFGHTLAWKQSDGGKKSLADCRDGLLVPFLDGMIDAANGKTRLVDGHEVSYGYRDPALFAQAREAIKLKASGLAADPAKYQNTVKAGFGLWLDYDWPRFGWNTSKLESNYFSPERFLASLRAAVEQTEEYVWIYTEKPRWWSNVGTAVDLPPAYIDAVQRVRHKLDQDRDAGKPAAPGPTQASDPIRGPGE